MTIAFLRSFPMTVLGSLNNKQCNGLFSTKNGPVSYDTVKRTLRFQAFVLSTQANLLLLSK